MCLRFRQASTSSWFNTIFSFEIFCLYIAVFQELSFVFLTVIFNKHFMVLLFLNDFFFWIFALLFIHLIVLCAIFSSGFSYRFSWKSHIRNVWSKKTREIQNLLKRKARKKWWKEKLERTPESICMRVFVYDIGYRGDQNMLFVMKFMRFNWPLKDLPFLLLLWICFVH